VKQITLTQARKAIPSEIVLAQYVDTETREAKDLKYYHDHTNRYSLRYFDGEKEHISGYQYLDAAVSAYNELMEG